MTRRGRALLLALLLLLATGCTGSGDPEGAATPSAGAPLDVSAIWTGAEQESFQAVLAAFTGETGIATRLTATGDDVGAHLDVRLADGDPPDVALLPQVGLLRDYAIRRQLRPLSQPVLEEVGKHQSPTFADLGKVAGQQYGVVFKIANKSVWWYSPAALTAAGARPPATWPEALATARRVGGTGTGFVSVGGADGWTLTDLFENLYLDSAGTQAYDRLARHDIPWTHPTVIASLTRLRELAAVPGGLAGGSTGVLATDFPASVRQVFGPAPVAASVFEGDFVASVIRSQKPTAVAGRDYDFFPFPRTGTGPPPVVVGADVAVAMSDDPRAQRLLAFLSTPKAAQPWASRGGFLSPDRDLPADAYPDELTRRLDAQVAAAERAQRVRFDLSDQPPTAFAATPGAGLYLHLRRLVAGASVQDVAQALEVEATEAFRRF